MTECERLIANGTFSAEFFKEETRCGFLVTTERKKIWAIELDLLKKFDSVCQRHGLCYFAFVGTLLGAIRHDGFIPWDDDIDLAMPRDDYEKMLALGKEFEYPYFLQTPWSDKDYYYSFAKLRNSLTSFVSKNFLYADFNQGIHLDFHPIDIWHPDENGEEVYAKISQLAYDNSTYMRMKNPYLNDEDKQRIKNYKGIDPLLACEKMRALGMTWHGQKSQYVCRNTMVVYGYRRNLFLAEDFDGTLNWNFEGATIPVPVGYDRILRTIYGDYMKLPPMEKRGTWHQGSIVSPDIPWQQMVMLARSAEKENTR